MLILKLVYASLSDAQSKWALRMKPSDIEVEEPNLLNSQCLTVMFMFKKYSKVQILIYWRHGSNNLPSLYIWYILLSIGF